MVRKQLKRFFRSHFKNIIDILSFICTLQCFFVVSLSMAYFTRYINIRQEVHGDHFHAVSLAGFTSSALRIEGEAAFVIASEPCLRRMCEYIADIVEYAGICCRIGTRCSADRILVDLYKLVDV